MTGLKHTLRIYAPPIFRVLRALKHFPERARRAVIPYRFREYGEAFHGDERWQELAALFKNLPLTSSLETGTFRADTALFLSRTFPELPVYTVELSGEYYRESAWRLRDSKNITLIKDSSPRALRRLVGENRLGAFPLVFLDAHWYDYWPILDELKELSPLQKAIIMIDDFEVPGKGWFEYDIYYDGTKTLKNNLDFIRPALGETYRILFPAYTPGDAGGRGTSLRGYVLLFKGFSDAEWRTAQRMIPQKYFREFDLRRNSYGG